MAMVAQGLFTAVVTVARAAGRKTAMAHPMPVNPVDMTARLRRTAVAAAAAVLLALQVAQVMPVAAVQVARPGPMVRMAAQPGLPMANLSPVVAP